jgi:hypothetical protein
MEKISKIWNLLVDTGMFTDEELKLIVSVNGYNEEAINDVIYVRYGYHDIEQLFSESASDKQLLKEYGLNINE